MNYISSNVEFVGPASDSNTRSISYARTQVEILGPTSDSNTRSVSYTRTQFEALGPKTEFYKENPRIHVLVIVLTILGPVLESFFQGIVYGWSFQRIFDFAISIDISIAIYLLTPDIVNIVRKITKG